MEERRHPRHSQRRPARRRRRLNPGFVLCSVCSVLIVICLCIGGVQYLVAQGEAKEQAAKEAAEQAARLEADPPAWLVVGNVTNADVADLIAREYTAVSGRAEFYEFSGYTLYRHNG